MLTEVANNVFSGREQSAYLLTYKVIFVNL